MCTQSLWWVDILERRLYRYGPADDGRASYDLGEEISAVAERAQGPGLIVPLRRGYALFDPEYASGRFCGGTMDDACEARTGALVCYTADGRCVRPDMGYAVTNGPTWSRDGHTMHLNDTVRGRVDAFDFEAQTGALSNPREWLRFAPDDGVCPTA